MDMVLIIRELLELNERINYYFRDDNDEQLKRYFYERGSQRDRNKQ